MGFARDPSTWSPRERAAVERQAAAGKKTVSTEALRKEQEAQKTREVAYQVGGKVTPTAKPKPPEPTVIKRRVPIRERVISGVKRFGAETKQFVAGIPRGAKSVATIPFAHLVRTEEYIESPYGFRRMTLYEQQAAEYGRATIGGKVGEFFGGLTFATVVTQPVVKGITPTTRGVTVTRVTPKGEFRAVGAIEAGERVYPVAVKGRAVRIPTTRITAAKGIAAIRTKPTITVGAKPIKALKFEGFKFRAISKKVAEISPPPREIRGVLGEVTKVTKSVVRKGIPKVKAIKEAPRLFVGRQVTTQITPTKAVSAAKIDIFKGLIKIGEAKEIGIIRQIPKEFPRIVRIPKGMPTIPKPTITKPIARQITKGVVETIAPSVAKLKTGFPLVSIPKVKQITTITPKEITAPVSKEITKVEPITRPKVRVIERPITLPREAQRVTPITQPMVKPIAATRLKLLPIQKVKPIEIPALKTKPVTRITYPVVPFAPPVAPSIPKGFGFVPITPLPSLALPRGKPLAPYAVERGFAYQPSIEALVRREFGEAPKEALPIRFRPITKKWKKKMITLFGGF